MDDDSLAHTKRNCEYHIVLALKYRYKDFTERSVLLLKNSTLFRIPPEQ